VHLGFYMNQPAKERVCCFVDGFNLYHALDDEPSLHSYKWLNIKKVASVFLARHQSLERVLYCTAYAKWMPAKVQRHRKIVKVYTDLGIEIVWGKFTERPRRCHICHKEFLSHEEKRTDVNIAIRLYDMASRDEYDRALVISGDSDLVPAIEMVLKRFPTKKVEILTPPGRRAKELTEASGIPRKKIKTKHLMSCQIPDPYTTRSGEIVHKPSEWR